MAVNRAVIRDIEDGGAGYFLVVPSFIDGSSGATVQTFGVLFPTSGITSRDTYISAAESAVNAYAVTQGYTLSGGIIWPSPTTAQINALITAAMAAIPAGLSSAPQAAIADGTTNLATNYNLATGLLGLATAMNSANGAQNDLATKFNTLLAELRTLGLLST